MPVEGGPRVKNLRVLLAASAAAGKRKLLRHKFIIALLVPAALLAINAPGIIKSLVYYDVIREHAVRRDIDPLLVVSIIYAESSFMPAAESHKGAVGLMQIIPSTFAELRKELGMKNDVSVLKDPRVNIKVGVYYLAKLRRERWVESDIELLAAYNAGRGKALSWKRDSGGRLTAEKIPYKETRDYVAKVTRTHRWLKKISGK
ncbi:MAG: lytic transglycosylase [Elusimicrobia bacterium HGW-Elusimicrobia-1]|nr:MAG: lytic transglycosylase [Elusimicrobia bacterium HGW-Elusimicrobia-1]